MLNKTLKVGVWSKDIPYMEALIRYFSLIGCEMIFEICSREDFSKQAEKDLWITDDEALGEQADLLIWEKRESLDSKGNDGKAGVYKYAGGYEIYHELIQVCFDKLGIRIKKPSIGGSDLILVGSSSGGSGKTAVAKGLAEALKRFGSKDVLYISLESIVCRDEGTEEGSGLEEYLYFLFSGRDVNINKFLKEDAYGVKEFKPAQGINPLKFMIPGEVCEIFNHIREQEHFQYIIVDAGDYGPLEEAVAEIADKLCLVETADSLPKGERLFKHISDKVTIGEIESGTADKVIRILNKWDTDFKDIEGSIRIYREETSEGILGLDRDFGSGIKLLMKNLTTN